MKVALILTLWGLTLLVQEIFPLLANKTEKKHTDSVKEAVLTDKKTQSDHLYRLLVAEVALNRQEPAIALEHYLAVAKATQDPEVAKRATFIALSFDFVKAALPPASIWATQQPEDIEAHLTLALLALRLNQPTQANQALTSIQKLVPNEAASHFVALYNQLPTQQERHQAQETLKQLTQTESFAKLKNAGTPLLALADIALNEGQPHIALHYTHRALKYPSPSTVAFLLHAQALYYTGSTQKAVVFLKNKVEQHPNDRLLRQNYTQLLLDQGQPEAAKKELAILIKSPYSLNEESLELARLAIQLQWLKEATDILKKVEKNPEHGNTARYFLARISEIKKAYPQAIDWYRQVEEGPLHVLSHIRAAGLLLEKKQWEQALGVLDDASPSDETEAKRLTLAKVDILSSRGQFSDALELLNKLLTYLPGDIDLLYARGLTAGNTGNVKLAEADLKEVLDFNPNHIDALNALGFLLTEKTTRFEEASTYLYRALKLDPDNPSILDSLGWLSYRQGQIKQSIKLLRQAMVLQPDAEIAAHLGEVLWHNGQHEEAQKVWYDALQGSPKHEKLLETIQRFKPREAGNHKVRK